MELNQIRQFRVIARTESISKASEELFIAQPSLSQTLKRLETELGTPLFDRKGRRIFLNGAGRIFLKYCDEIVAALDSAAKEIGEYIGSAKSDINILFESTSFIILEIAEKMRKNYPWSVPHMYQGSCGDWDLKVCSDICPDIGCPSTVIIEEPIGVIMQKTNPLAAKREITKKDLEGLDFLSLNPTDGLSATIEHFCRTADFRQNITMYVDSPSVMEELLERDFGIALAPRYTWYGYYSEKLEFRPVSDMPMRHYIHLVMNNKKYVTKEMQVCYEAISKCYKEYAAEISRICSDIQ